MDDKTYHLTINDGENHLHGGVHGFWDKVWKAHPVNNSTVAMSYMSAAGEEGYPGNLAITVTYTLTQDNALKIEYQATTDSATILNPTSHSYFNLHGTTAGSTNTHLLTLNADRFTPTDAELIPTGELDSVAGTPMDFRQPTLIGERIDADFEPMKLAKGYDHNLGTEPKRARSSLLLPKCMSPRRESSCGSRRTNRPYSFTVGISWTAVRSGSGVNRQLPDRYRPRDPKLSRCTESRKLSFSRLAAPERPTHKPVSMLSASAK